MTTDFRNKHSLESMIFRHLSLKNPQDSIDLLRNTIPANILAEIECIRQGQKLMLITDETWLSWLKIRRQKILKCLPKNMQLVILPRFHESLKRPEPEPAELTLNQENAKDLNKLAEKQKNERLKNALQKIANKSLTK